MDGVSAALELAQGMSQVDLQRWRKAGYAAIDRMIESLLAKIKGSEDFERVSFVLEQESKDVTAAVFEQMLNSLGADELARRSCPCPECGKILRSPRNLRRSIDTLYGRIAVQRPYFYCRPCHRGTIPFDDKLGISPSYKQYDLQRKAARLFAEVPYERAAELFKELTGSDVSNHAMHDMAKGLAESSEITQVLPSRHAMKSSSKRTVVRPFGGPS